MAAALLAIAFFGGVATLCSSVRLGVSRAGISEYEDFRRRFSVDRNRSSSVGYLERIALFEQRREAVAKHNAQPGRLWTAGINKFADHTESEFQALMGHRPARQGRRASVAEATAGSRRAHATVVAGALLQHQPGVTSLVVEQVNWVQDLGETVPDQGACGSCWAVAAVGALNAHAKLLGHRIAPLSFEEVTDCVVNTRHCGGTGGCKGATSELALDWAHTHGVHLQSEYTTGYLRTGKDGNCQFSNVRTAAFRTAGYVRVPENSASALKEALNIGPTVVSAGASSWDLYHSGVFNGCSKDVIVNHAILAMGYGKDADGHAYWTIRNSWGPEWGEDGYIRILRHEADDEYCGRDTDYQMGVGCDGDVTEVKVCGMCGILSDSAYPVMGSSL